MGPYQTAISTYAPGSQQLTHSLLSGAQPYSRANEQVVNATIDPSVFYKLSPKKASHFGMMEGNDTTSPAIEQNASPEAWASVLPGMICVSHTQHSKHYRGRYSSNNAAHVIACAFGLSTTDEENYSFAGVARSQSVRTKGMSQSSDDHFTMNRGGVVTILNTSGEHIYNGDMVAWTFTPSANSPRFTGDEPRRVCVMRVEPGMYHPNVMGRCINYAPVNGPFDLKIGDE